MPSMRIPTPLRPYTGGQREIALHGTSVGEVLDDLVQRHPAIQPHLFLQDGSLRPFVNLFLGENNIRDLQGTATPLQTDDSLLLIPSVAGG